MSSSEPNHRAIQLRAASQLVTRPLTWLWPGRLALGKLAMLDGDPDLGKSLVTLDLCARLSTGRPFPDGSPSPGPANALVLNAEDSAEDTIRPRLQALGADLDRVFILDRDDLGADDALSIDLLAALAQTQEQLHQRLRELTPTAFPELEAAWQAAALPPLPDHLPPGQTTIPEQYLILVTCRDELQQAELLRRFRGEGLECKALLA